MLSKMLFLYFFRLCMQVTNLLYKALKLWHVEDTYWIICWFIFNNRYIYLLYSIYCLMIKYNYIYIILLNLGCPLNNVMCDLKLDKEGIRIISLNTFWPSDFTYYNQKTIKLNQLSSSLQEYHWYYHHHHHSHHCTIIVYRTVSDIIIIAYRKARARINIVWPVLIVHWYLLIKFFGKFVELSTIII